MQVLEHQTSRSTTWSKAFLFTLLLVFSVSTAQASLIGTSVLGNYFVTGQASPYMGPSTQVIGGGTEFTFSNGGATLDTDFSDTGLTIRFHATGGLLVSDLTSTFQSLTPGAFAGITTITDTFPTTNSISVTANTITWRWIGGGPFTNPDFTATYAITSAPEPGTVVLLALGFGVLGLARKRWTGLH